jgi:hypothetical protein
VFVDGIVSRVELVQAFRSDLLRFFSSEFDLEEWDDSGSYLKDQMLTDSWLVNQETGK